MKPFIREYKGITPKIGKSTFVAETAAIIGDVEIGDDCSIWYNVVMRGDVNDIKVGDRSNIQDGTVVHVTKNKWSTYIGNDVLIGHNAMIHGCTLEDNAFIGMGAVILDGAVVESHAMVAAGALVTQGKRVPSGELWAGNPAKKMRDVKPEEREAIMKTTAHYVDLSKDYMEDDV